MAKDPAFLFYSDNFHSGTQFFTNEQTGKYIRLLCAQHQHGHLSERQMLIICGEKDPEIWAKFKQDEAGKFYNERLECEIERRSKYSSSRASNRKGKNKKEKKKDVKHTSKSYDNHMGTGTGNEIGNKTEPGTGNGKSLHSRMKTAFTETYQRRKGIAFIWSAKEGFGLKQVIPKIAEVIKSEEEEKVLEFWTTLLPNLPEWYDSNGFSPSVINSKFNEIVNQIRKPNATTSATEKINRDLTLIIAARNRGSQGGNTGAANAA